MSRRDRARLARACALALALPLAACDTPPGAAVDAAPEALASQGQGGEAVEIEHIYPEGVERLAVFTPAVRVGDLLFLSGAIGTTPGSLSVVEGGIGPETRQALENVRTVLRAAGADLDDVAKCTVFLADINDYAAMNEVYGPFWGGRPPPARSTVAGSGLALGARVEIECIARAPAGG